MHSNQGKYYFSNPDAIILKEYRYRSENSTCEPKAVGRGERVRGL